MGLSLGLAGCGASTEDLALTSKDHLCKNYQQWAGDFYWGYKAKQYSDELKRRGENCFDYKPDADVTVDVN